MQKISKNGVFTNKSIMFTGGFEKMSRSEAKTIAEENGAKILGTVTKKLDYLVIGNSKPTKNLDYLSCLLLRFLVLIL